jgi:hypothetical protein
MVEELCTWAAINKQQHVLKERLYQNLKGFGGLPSVQEVLDSSQYYICSSSLCICISSIVLNFLVKTGGFVDLNLLSSTSPQKIFKKFGPEIHGFFSVVSQKFTKKRRFYFLFFNPLKVLWIEKIVIFLKLFVIPGA